jgi:hypothetical protein
MLIGRHGTCDHMFIGVNDTADKSGDVIGDKLLLFTPAITFCPGFSSILWLSVINLSPETTTPVMINSW